MSNLNDIFNPHIIDQWNQCGNTSPDSSFSLWEENKTRFTTNQLCKMRPLLNSSNVPYLSYFEQQVTLTQKEGETESEFNTREVSAQAARDNLIADFNNLEWETNYTNLQTTDVEEFENVFHHGCFNPLDTSKQSSFNEFGVGTDCATNNDKYADAEQWHEAVQLGETDLSLNCSFIHDNYHVKDMCANTFCLLDFMAVKLDACNNQLCDKIETSNLNNAEGVIPTDVPDICYKTWRDITTNIAAAAADDDGAPAAVARFAAVERETYEKSYTSSELDILLTKYENETREEELKNDFKKLYNSNLFEICYLVTGIVVILYIVKKS